MVQPSQRFGSSGGNLVHFNKVAMQIKGFAGFAFAGMAVQWCFPQGIAFFDSIRIMVTLVIINLVRFFFPQLALSQKRKQIRIAPMGIEKNDLFKTVSANFVQDSLD
jgi:hypothetical protein